VQGLKKHLSRTMLLTIAVVLAIVLSIAALGVALSSRSSVSMGLTPDSTAAEVGTKVHVEGFLRGSAGIANASVSLKVVLPDGTSTYPLQGRTTITSAEGAFSFDYVPTVKGEHELKATFNDDGKYSTTVTSARITAEASSNTDTLRYVVVSDDDAYHVQESSGAYIYNDTDASAAIQMAIDSLTQGREKVLLQGTFILKDAILMRNSTVLQLDGEVRMEDGSNTHMVVAENESDYEIVGGEWDANQAGQEYGGTDRDAFQFMYCNNITVRNLAVHDSPYDNIACIRCYNVTISGIETYNAGDIAKGTGWQGHGLMLVESNNCSVVGCHIHDCAAGGCYFYCENDSIERSVNNNMIRGNLVERTETSGLSISLRGPEDKGVNNLIELNTVVDCGIDGEHYGINLGFGNPLVYAENCTVQNNLVYETGDFYSVGGVGAGIVAISYRSYIASNVIFDTTDVGICIMGDHNIVCLNSVDVVRTAYYPGIQIADGSYNEVVNNTVTNCEEGITVETMLTNKSSYNRIAYNHIENMAKYVVMVSGAEDVGNVIEHNTFAGSRVIIDRGTDTVIRYNN